MKRVLAAAAAALVLMSAAVSALAQTKAGESKAGESKGGSSRTAPTAATPSAAEEQAIRARLESAYNLKPTSIARTPFGWFEVVVNGDLVYLDPTTNFLFTGEVIDTRTRESLTRARREDLQRVDFAKLPLNQAVRLRFGNGSRQMVTFEDPNCPYCRKLHQDLRSLKDATVYVFLYPILSPDSTDKARAIWCAKDRADAWNDLMLENKNPPPAPANCNHPTDRVVELGRSLGVTGTPTLIFQDGSRLPGAVPIEQIEQKLASARPPAPAAKK
ncbi:MAG: DsbC family protein [Burkholderiales bacterium]|jgi:thiol:disulfide interchange protein DsbC|nr:DsbC family protein [Burkholderiales bacterium]MCA3227509.1 DsbC family protein [Burkholderiales bacterium]